MTTNSKTEVSISFPTLLQSQEIPIEQFAGNVYQAAPPATKRHLLAELVGKVYDSAPLVEKSHLIEYLMKPLGTLSLVAVANGIFAKICFRGASLDFRVGIDEAQNVQTSDVIALANYVQQVSTQAVYGVAEMLATSPVMASSAAAVLLVQILTSQSRK